MRNTIIAGNWKMHKTFAEAKEFFQEISDWEKDFVHKCKILIFPPDLYVPSALEITNINDIDIGVQNIYYKDFGAFTGQISAKMLSSIGCNYSLVGHSERRKIFHETNEETNLKLKSLLENNFNIVLCIGETENERETRKTEDVLATQLNIGLKDISAEEMQNIIIAYEPVWAIGTGKTATPEIAQDAHKFVRNWLSEKYGNQVSDEISILYGGSVKVSNIEKLIKQEDIDGALIGGASLNLDDFKKIIEISENNINRQ